MISSNHLKTYIYIFGFNNTQSIKEAMHVFKHDLEPHGFVLHSDHFIWTIVDPKSFRYEHLDAAVFCANDNNEFSFHLYMGATYAFSGKLSQETFLKFQNLRSKFGFDILDDEEFHQSLRAQKCL